jgi:DNA-binding Lrp family transcriptional regulator
MFLTGGLLLFLVLNWTGVWVLGYFVKHPNDFVVNGVAAAMAITIGIVAYKSERVYGLANDVATELKKVTWPTRKETQAATVAAALRDVPGVLETASVAGPYDVIARAQAPDIDELAKLAASQVQALDGVTRTLTCPVVHL